MTPEDALERLGTVTRRSAFAYATSWPIEEVIVERGDERLGLLVKRLGGHVEKPGTVIDSDREPAAYALLQGAELETPRCYGAGSGWVLIERVPGVPLWQSADFADWLRAARWAARLHARFAVLSTPVRHLLSHDRSYYDGIIHRVPSLGDLAGAAARARERLLALPRTLIHGELYPSNIVVVGERIAVVDWETAAFGPCVTDLAALVTGFAEGRASAIVAAYGGCPERDLAAARLMLALQWVGWSPRWEPPSEHRRDWLAEARAAAELLR